MTWLHLLKDCAEINKMLNASIKSLATSHWPLGLNCSLYFRIRQNKLERVD